MYIYIYIYKHKIKIKEKKIFKYSHNKSTGLAQPRRCQDGHTSLINKTHPKKTQNKSYYTYNQKNKQKNKKKTKQNKNTGLTKEKSLKAHTSSHNSI